jgi:hypothetical protein
VDPVQGVSNKTLLKNPYNTLSEPIGKVGNRPWMITTDNLGNVFAKSEVKMVKGVTNDTLLKNPFNIAEVPVGEKRTLSLQRIKDINSKRLPDYITENRGINEVMLQIVTMIMDQPVKLITIHLLKILITKNAQEQGYQTQQKILRALNAFDQVMNMGRRIFKENTLSPTSIPEKLRQYVDIYEAEIKNIYGNMSGQFKNLTADIQTGLAELGLLSNGLSRMFEYNNSVDPSNTLTQAQIQAAANVAVPQPVQVQPPQSSNIVAAAQQIAAQQGLQPDPTQAGPTQAGPTQAGPTQAGPSQAEPFSKASISALIATLQQSGELKSIMDIQDDSLSFMQTTLRRLLRIKDLQEKDANNPQIQVIINDIKTLFADPAYSAKLITQFNKLSAMPNMVYFPQYLQDMLFFFSVATPQSPSQAGPAPQVQVAAGRHRFRKY